MPNPEAQLKEAVDRIVSSKSPKKLVVAGPGTGKTTLFRKLLESSKGDSKSRLVLTFINNLKADLDKSLSDFATVFTLHGYCQSVLRRQGAVRAGLTADFKCLPGLVSLIKGDWKYLRSEPAPQFVEKMRSLENGDELDFYFVRANYYDAVDFDDSVFRVHQRLKENSAQISAYDLVLIDEYQDFNRMEAGLIDLLSVQSPIVIAGDDDQALYSQLRGSSWDFIRLLHQGDQYEKFVLPFCMRCPEVIVGAVNDIMAKAQQLKKLPGRINKPYLHFEPVKGGDSKQYPKIDLVGMSVQRGNANYFGRYIEQAMSKIPKGEIDEANKKGEPAVLIIGAKQYLRQIIEYLTGRGYAVSTKEEPPARLEKEIGYEILDKNAKSNLGWRLLLEFEKENLRASIIQKAAEASVSLVEIIPSEIRDRILNEVKVWADEQANKKDEDKASETEAPQQPFIKATSFEGSKGMSAQHVFIVGMHENELPRDSTQIQDIEICRFVVGLTRAKKKCSLLHTGRFADQPKRPSPFFSWIKKERYEFVTVNAQYWKNS